MANSKYINKRTGKYGPDSSTYRQDRLARVMRTNWSRNKEPKKKPQHGKRADFLAQYKVVGYEKAKEIINKDFKNKDFKREVFNDETLKKWIEEENEK